ncbi:MAG: BatD family protein [Bacteroidales bacterium]|nr:BatD family protein [Bacteroidales bacterium]
MKKILLLIPFLIFFTACENGADTEKKSNTDLNKSKKREDIKFTANSENIAEIGEIFQVTFEINNNPDNFNPPDFENFDVLSGPSTSSFSSTQYINSKSTKEIKTSYTYTISAPNPGEYTIKEAEINIDGNVYKSNPLKIKILGETGKINNSKNTPNNLKNNNQDIFISVEYSKSNVFNGEFIIAVFKIYNKSEFHNIIETSFPGFKGFKVEMLEAPRQLVFHNEIINGKKYKVALLKKVFLIAQKPGNYSISPYDVEVKIRKKDGKTRDFFGNLVDKYKIINKKISTGKTNIIVKPIPAPIPEKFSGITGKDFQISSELEKNKIKTDNGTNFKITISGNGNIHLLNDFNLQLPEGLTFFKPEIEKSEKYTENGLYGERIFNYIIIGNKDGTYKIDPVEFTYFNPVTEKYETIYASEHEITVGKGTGYNELPDINKDITVKDIRYISTENVNLKKQGKGFAGTTLYYISFLFLIVLFISVILITRRIKNANSDIVALKIKKANEVSKKRLNNALKHMKENDNNAFYKEILNVIWGYLSDKLSISADALTNDSVEDILKEKNTDTDLIIKLQSIIEICGYAQYSPVGEEGSPENIYKDTEAVINNLEAYL